MCRGGVAQRLLSVMVAAHEVGTTQVGDAEDEGNEAVALVVVAMSRMRTQLMPRTTTCSSSAGKAQYTIARATNADPPRTATTTQIRASVSILMAAICTTWPCPYFYPETRLRADPCSR